MTMQPTPDAQARTGKKGDNVSRLLQGDNNPKLAGAKEALKKKLLKSVMQQALAELGSPDAMAEAIMASVGPDHALVNGASERLRKQMLDAITTRAVAALGDEREAAEKARAALGEEGPVVIGASSVLREMIIQDIIERSMSSLEDCGAVARQARNRMDADHEAVVRGVEALRALMLDEVAERSVASMDDAETVAEAARARVGTDHEAITRAADALHALLVDMVAERSVATLGDPAAVAEEARARVDAEHAALAEAASHLREHLLETIAERTTGSLADASAAADEARQRVDEDHPALVNAVEALRDALTREIAERTTEAVANVDETAARAKAFVSEDDARITAAVEAATERLYRDVAERSTRALADVDEAAERARNLVPEDAEALRSAVDALRERLLAEVASRATEALADGETVAREARRHVPEDHRAFVEAATVLRDMLIEEIARRSTEALGDSGETARQAKARVPEDDAVLTHAGDELRELLIEDIVRHTTEALRDAEAAARDAMNHVDDEDAVLVEARRVLKERMLQSMLNEAIREINDAVDPEQGEYDFFFKEAVAAASKAAFSRETESFATDGEEASEASSISESAAEEEAAAPESFIETEESGFEMDADVEDEILAFFADDSEEAGASDEETGATMEAPAPENAVSEAPVEEDTDAEEAYIDLVADELFPPEVSENGSVFLEIEANHTEDEELQAEGNEKAWTTTAIWSDEEYTGGDGAALPDAEPVGFSVPAGVKTEESPAPAEVFYVYGVMSSAAAEAIDAMPEAGIDPAHGVAFLPFRDLQIIYSPVSAEEFGPEVLAENMKDAAWVQQSVRAHAQVMDQFRTAGTLIPLRFGTVCTTEEEIAEMVDERYAYFSDAIERLRDKQEWGLRMYGDLEVLRMRISEGEQKVEESLGVISKGIARFIKDEMGKMENLDEEELIRLITEHSIRRTHESLLEVAESGVFKPLMGEKDAEKGQLISNAAYLVAQDREELFQATIEEIASESMSLGLRFELTGPWPPYHFVDAGESGSGAAA